MFRLLPSGSQRPSNDTGVLTSASRVAILCGAVDFAGSFLLARPISAQPTPTSVILDPSVLFEDEALEWLRDAKLWPFLAVSRSLWEMLNDGAHGEAFAPFAEPDEDRANTVRALIAENGIRQYSYEEALHDAAYDEEGREVTGRLLEQNGHLGPVLADEWAFVTSQSVAVIKGNILHTLAAFEKAKAEVVRCTREQMDKVLTAVRGHLPDQVMDALKWVAPRARRVPNWLLLGGSIASAAIPAISWPLVGVDLGRHAVIIVAGDP